MRGCMIWIGLATLVVVFVVGFRVLTSDSRRAIRRLSERLGITPVPLESMIDQLGKAAGNEYLRYLERPNEAHLQNAAQVLLIWGDRDTETPLWMGQQMEKEIADSGLVVLEGGTHFAYLEQATRFQTIVRQFLLN